MLYEVITKGITMIERIKNIFITETQKDLTAIQDQIELVTNNIFPKELIEKIFRTMHTIKGSAPMFGFPHLTEIAMPVSRAYEALYRGKGIQVENLLKETVVVVNILHTALTSKEDSLPVTEDKTQLLSYNFV